MRWLPLVCAVAVALVVGVGPMLLVAPVYQVDTQVFVTTRTDAANPNQELLQGGRFAVDRVASYAGLATTPRVLDPVIRQLGLTTSADELASRITTVVPADTVLLEIELRDGTADGAAAQANAVAGELVRAIEEIETPASGPPSPVTATVLRQAAPPSAPLWPNITVNVTNGVVAGLIAGVLVLVLLRRTDTTVDDATDVARVSGLPVLAEIPDDTSGSVPIARRDPEDGPSEGYQQLLANLRFAFVDDEPGVLLVAGGIPGEGTTSVAGDLALGLQQMGLRVCLVDGDLRRPSVAGLFGLHDDVGLTSVLVGHASVEDAVQKTVHGLAVVTGGPVPPNPAELLASGGTSTLLRELARRYDIVVVDSAPLLPVTDASVLASRADATLYVVRGGRTTRKQVGLALAGLSRVGARVLGTVVTAAPSKAVSRRSSSRTDARHRRRPAAPTRS